jgi:hypothetical protein
MEKLDCSRRLYFYNDWRIPFCGQQRRNVVDGFGKYKKFNHLEIPFQVFLIQLRCFYEIIGIGLCVYRLFDLPWFRTLSWYFLLTSDYFFFGESLIDYWSIVLRKDVSYRVNFIDFLLDFRNYFEHSLYVIALLAFRCTASDSCGLFCPYVKASTYGSFLW